MFNPIDDSQAGWLEAFNKIAQENGDSPLLDQFDNDFEEDEWTW